MQTYETDKFYYSVCSVVVARATACDYNVVWAFLEFNVLAITKYIRKNDNKYFAYGACLLHNFHK